MSKPRITLPMAEIVELYAAGESGDSLAAAYGVCNKTILARLRERGIEVRGRGKQKNPNKKDVAILSFQAPLPEADKIRRAAEAEGISVSKFLARKVLCEPPKRGGFLERMWGAF